MPLSTHGTDRLCVYRPAYKRVSSFLFSMRLTVPYVRFRRWRRVESTHSLRRRYEPGILHAEIATVTHTPCKVIIVYTLLNGSAMPCASTQQKIFTQGLFRRCRRRVSYTHGHFEEAVLRKVSHHGVSAAREASGLHPERGSLIHTMCCPQGQEVVSAPWPRCDVLQYLMMLWRRSRSRSAAFCVCGYSYNRYAH